MTKFLILFFLGSDFQLSDQILLPLDISIILYFLQNNNRVPTSCAFLGRARVLFSLPLPAPLPSPAPTRPLVAVDPRVQVPPDPWRPPAEPRATFRAGDTGTNPCLDSGSMMILNSSSDRSEAASRLCKSSVSNMWASI